MSTEQGWIGTPPPKTQWRDSHYSRTADRIAQAAAEDKDKNRR